jgi:multidrug efflux pump subunit AcrA (membrane-fusion protein)
MRRLFSMRHRWVLALISVVMLVAIALVIYLPRLTATTYQFTKVRQGGLTVSLSAVGSIQAAFYDVTAVSGSKITEIDVHVGQQVKAGAPLAKLDPSSLQGAVDRAQGTVTVAQTQLDNAQMNLSNVEAQTQAQLTAAYDQEQQAIAACKRQGTSAPANCEQTAQDNYAAAQALASQEIAAARQQVSAAEAQLNAAQTQLSAAQASIGAATLTSPHAGTVASINGHVGGVPTSSPFIQIVDLSALQVATTISESNVIGVANGDPVTFTVNAYGVNHTLDGQVSAVSPVGQVGATGVNYAVTIDVNMTDAQNMTLLTGMTVKAAIQTAYRPDAILIPVSAVTYAQHAAQQNTPITHSQAITAQYQATQLISDLQQQNPTAAQDNPTASYVIERVKGHFIAKPVVLGLTDGVSYEVLAGPTIGESIIIGQS